MKETMEIPLTRGQVAIVDAEDFEWLSQYKWFASWQKSARNYYANTYTEEIVSYGRKIESMHRLIMKAKKGEIVDHINGNGLDNRKENLRIVSKRENAINCKMNKANTSGVMGVTFDKNRNKWRAFVIIHKKIKNLGRFETFEEAVQARKDAEKLYYGEFARSIDDPKIEFVKSSRRDSTPCLWYMFGYGEVYVVPLLKDSYSIVDVCDYDIAAASSWSADKKNYVCGKVNGKVKKLHRVIMNAPDDKLVDHINGDRHDNRRCNLRIATHAQNSHNTKGYGKIRAVRKNIQTTEFGTFMVRLYIDGKNTCLGSFPTLEEALEVRNAAYREHRGEFARYD
jgi:hypothetical protein